MSVETQPGTVSIDSCLVSYSTDSPRRIPLIYDLNLHILSVLTHCVYSALFSLFQTSPFCTFVGSLWSVPPGRVWGLSVSGLFPLYITGISIWSLFVFVVFGILVSLHKFITELSGYFCESHSVSLIL